MKPMQRLDKGATLVAALLAGVALLTLWQSREFSPFAAFFPRAVGSALLLCSLLVLWRVLRQKVPPSSKLGSEGLLRSGLLVLMMLIWVSMLETAGFLISSWVGFLVLAMLTNREPLNARRTLGFAAAALICVLGLQFLFQRGLDVQLPVGVWLPGIHG